MTTLAPIISELEELITESWQNKPDNFKHQVMSKISETIGTEEYFGLLQKHPVKLSPTLEDLGPLLRL